MDVLAQYGQSHPEIALIAAAIVAQAAIASKAVQALKNWARSKGKDFPATWARVLCVGASVGIAYLEMRTGDYPWQVWGGAIALAAYTGPWFHGATKAGAEVTG